MKKLSTSLIAVLFSLLCVAQTAIPSPDKSPLDMSTFPPDYAMGRTKTKTVSPLVARVIYSRPQKNDRIIFGDLLEYEKVWRFGANEATEIEFFRDVRVGGKPVKKGRYTLYAIPKPGSWVMIVNKELDTWGAFNYDASKDVVRAEIPVQKTAAADLFYIYFDKLPNGCALHAGWDDSKIVLPITY